MIYIERYTLKMENHRQSPIHNYIIFLKKRKNFCLKCKVNNILFSRTNYLTIKAQNDPKNATRLISFRCKNI